MDTVDLIIKSATTFYDELRSDSNGRYRSWEHCYKCFHDARNNPTVDLDYLSLQLAFYLASWGMYRGSSFLLQKDYQVHVPVVEEVLKSQYDCLFGIECIELRKIPIILLANRLWMFNKKGNPGQNMEIRSIKNCQTGCKRSLARDFQKQIWDTLDGFI